MKRILAVVLSLTMMAAMFPVYSLADESSDPIEIVFWHDWTDHQEEAIDNLIDQFNESQSEYKVVAEQQPYSEFDSKLLQAVSNGVGPDMTHMFASDAVNYINEGYLYDLTDLLNDPENGIPDLAEQTPPGLYSEFTQWGNDSIYMVPVLFTSEVLYYNKTMFDELGLSEPTTWDEVEECAKAIYDAYGIAGFGTDSITDTFQGWMIQSGSGYIDVDSKTIDIDRDIAIEYLNWFKNGVDEGYFRLVGEDNFFSNVFGSQRVGMYVGSSAGVDYVYAAIPEEGEDGYFEPGCCALPQAGEVSYVSDWGSPFVCLSQDEEHAKGVVAFLKFLTERDNLIYWATSFGASPARMDVANDEEYVEYASSNIALSVLREELEMANYLPSVVGAATVRTEIDKMVQMVALGESDAETAFDNFVETCNAALQQ